MRFEELKELITIFEKSDMSDMEVHFNNVSVHLSREKGQVVHKNTPEAVPLASAFVSSENVATSVKEEKSQAKEIANTNDAKYIKAPIVGTFYQSASPEKPPYVNVGDKVQKGDIVCIIEAMKFMNEVTSDEDGEVAEIFVKDGEFVEFGAPLFKLK